MKLIVKHVCCFVVVVVDDDDDDDDVDDDDDDVLVDDVVDDDDDGVDVVDVVDVDDVRSVLIVLWQCGLQTLKIQTQSPNYRLRYHKHECFNVCDFDVQIKEQAAEIEQLGMQLSETGNVNLRHSVNTRSLIEGEKIFLLRQISEMNESIHHCDQTLTHNTQQFTQLNKNCRHTKPQTASFDTNLKPMVCFFLSSSFFLYIL
jgi:hypothetical protein